ncbi:MAG: hypothetical protein ACKOWO_09685 [Sediminibacterium sp.]
MRKIPLAAFVSLYLLTGSSLFAQNATVIKSSNNGKLNYSYSTHASNQFSVQIVLKNDQFIYKQELDTLQIQSAEALSQLKQDLQNAMTALQNANSNFKVERSNYSLFSNDTGVAGFYIVFSNKAGTIQTANNKFQVKVLLDWLNSFEFGKS